MGRSIPATREEKRLRREEIARKAETGQLRFPGAFREIREAVDLTQADFGKKFGLTRMQVIALEKGTANPTLETMQKIGRIFGFTVGFVSREKSDG